MRPMANTAASTTISPRSGRLRGFRTTSRWRTAGVCLTPAHIVASFSTVDTGRSAARIGDLDAVPTATECLVEGHRVGQHLLVTRQQPELRGQQRALVLKHIELRHRANLELRGGLNRYDGELVDLLLQLLFLFAMCVEVDQCVLDFLVGGD